MGLTFISREEPLAGGAWIIMGGVVVYGAYEDMGLTFISREEPLAGGAWIIMGGVVA